MSPLNDLSSTSQASNSAIHPAQQLLEMLFAGQDGTLELRTFDHPDAARLRDFVPVNQGRFDFSRVLKYIHACNERRIGAFFGIALRTADAAEHRKGDAAHCQTLTAFFLDDDFKIDGGEAKARQILNDLPIKPSIVVNSGGGLQTYYLLDKPVDPRDDATKSLMKRFAQVAGVEDEKCSEPVRVFRLPGSLNCKPEYGEPRPVTFDSEPTGQRFNISEIEQILGGTQTTGGDRKERWTFPADVTSRHPTFFEALRSMKAQNFSKGTTWAAILKANEELGARALDVEGDLKPWFDRAWEQPDQASFASVEVGEDFARHLGGAKKGQIIDGHQDNIRLALKRLGVQMKFDEFSDQILVATNEWTERLEDALLERLWLRVDSTFKFRPSIDFFTTVLKDEARRHAFHPVRQYLDLLEWDGQKRIDNWLSNYCGAKVTPYTAAVGPLWFTAGVRRVRRPGCKFDEMLMAESSVQGSMKSSGWRIICPRDEWFGDDLPLGVDSKQVIERTRGKWIIEASDLHGYSSAGVERMKAFLSRQSDGPARMAYARVSVEVPRQFLMCGSTNTNRLVHCLGSAVCYKPNNTDPERIATPICYRSNRPRIIER